jgi:transposase
MKTHATYLGIDISKTTLHLATSEKFVKKFSNTAAGHRQLIERIVKLETPRVVLEASGGYERRVCETLQDAGLSVTVAQPGCVRNFAKSLKVLAKTDELDARVIARFGEATQPAPMPRTAENVRNIRALCDRRQQIVEDRVREINRLEACADSDIAAEIQISIDELSETEHDLDRRITELMESDADLKRKADVMMEQKGVAGKTASTLLAQFPELGSLTREQTAALAGLAPHAQESGNWKGKRRIYGGRAAARKALYMAARVAARWCPVISEFYNRLRQNGKPYKVAIIACARKLIVRLNTLLKQFHTPENSPNATIST